MKLKIETWPIDKVLPFAKNARLHSEAQVAAVSKSIAEFGFVNPCLVDADGVLIAGHCRILSAKQIGMEAVPVIRLGHLTEIQARALRLADNQLPQLGSWSAELIAAEISDLKLLGYDVPLLGFPESQLRGWGISMGTESSVDPEATPELPKETVVKVDDLWVLGNHRLLCGSSTKADDVVRLMDGKRASLFSTDPPYAVGYIGGQHPESDANRGSAKRNKNWSKVYHEADGEKDGEEFYDAFVKIAVEHAIERRAAWYCWHSSIRAPMVERVWNKHGAFGHQQIIWVKTRAVLTYSVYMWQHEPCLMGWIRGMKPRIQSRGNEFQTTIWNVPNSEIESKDHPTSKPTRLFRTPMEIHTVAGEICYEPFSGSGSQIIAAEILGRRCFAMEVSPQFIEVAIRRWEGFTNRKATFDGRTLEEVAKARRKGKAKGNGVTQDQPASLRSPRRRDGLLPPRVDADAKPARNTP